MTSFTPISAPMEIHFQLRCPNAPLSFFFVAGRDLGAIAVAEPSESTALVARGATTVDEVQQGKSEVIIASFP